MIERVKALLGFMGAGHEAPDPQQEVRLAAAVLLVEAAVADGQEDAREMVRMKRVLARHFDLDAADTDDLVERAAAIAADAVDWNRFTRVLKQGFDHEERIEMLEMLWSVVLADGELHAFEDSLIRRIAALLYVTDHERALARRRAQASLDADSA